MSESNQLPFLARGLAEEIKRRDGAEIPTELIAEWAREMRQNWTLPGMPDEPGWWIESALLDGECYLAAWRMLMTMRDRGRPVADKSPPPNCQEPKNASPRND